MDGGWCELEGELGEVGVVELVDSVPGVEEVEVVGEGACFFEHLLKKESFVIRSG